MDDDDDMDDEFSSCTKVSLDESAHDASTAGLCELSTSGEPSGEQLFSSESIFRAFVVSLEVIRLAEKMAS